jgi:hypothetical protein
MRREPPPVIEISATPVEGAAMSRVMFHAFSLSFLLAHRSHRDAPGDETGRASVRSSVDKRKLVIDQHGFRIADRTNANDAVWWIAQRVKVYRDKASERLQLQLVVLIGVRGRKGQ